MSFVDPTSMPAIDPTQMPAAVQKGGQKAEQLYSTALQFEQVLVQQLTQQIDFTGSDSSDSSDDSSDSSSSDGTTSLYSQMLPDALAQGITNGGGIGLASSIYDSLARQQGLPTTDGQS
jgi:Rod binding domain-containing protein